MQDITVFWGESFSDPQVSILMQTDRLWRWIVYLSFVKTKGAGWGLNTVKYLAYMLIITRCNNNKGYTDFKSVVPV